MKHLIILITFILLAPAAAHAQSALDTSPAGRSERETVAALAALILQPDSAALAVFLARSATPDAAVRVQRAVESIASEIAGTPHELGAIDSNLMGHVVALRPATGGAATHFVAIFRGGRISGVARPAKRVSGGAEQPVASSRRP